MRSVKNPNKTNPKQNKNNKQKNKTIKLMARKNIYRKPLDSLYKCWILMNNILMIISHIKEQKF